LAVFHAKADDENVERLIPTECGVANSSQVPRMKSSRRTYYREVFDRETADVDAVVFRMKYGRIGRIVEYKRMEIEHILEQIRTTEDFSELVYRQVYRNISAYRRNPDWTVGEPAILESFIVNE
jgi:hypothetical protein